MADQLIVWVREQPGRKIIQEIEPSPDGWSVTTKWIENDEVKRQDCQVALRIGTSSSGNAAGFLKRLFGG